MNLWQSLTGMVRLEIITAEPEEALRQLLRLEIPVYRVALADPMTLHLSIAAGHRKQAAAICEKRGYGWRLLSRLGLRWPLAALLRRPVLTGGIAALTALTLFLPTRVLFVRTEGNRTVPENRILEAAHSCGIRFGAERREVRSEKMKNALLEEIPQLRWAGINTSGCSALISVQERETLEEAEPPAGLVAVAAERDGVITSCTVTGGNGLCAVGQGVKAGQILISPYTDCGIAIRAEHAEGRIIAATRRCIRAVSPMECTVRLDPGVQERRFSLIIGKKRINFWKDSGIWDATCDRMYAEYYITLPGGFRLPVCLAVQTFTRWETCTGELPPPEEALKSFAREYTLDQMTEGEITGGGVSCRQEPGILVLAGQYLCRENIGREIVQKIGEYNG